MNLRLITSVLTLSAAVMIGPNLNAESGPSSSQSDTSWAKTVFERLKGLEGEWIGTSTKGWTDTITYKTVAGGSVVVEESFGAHPNETMYTMFHLDGNRLLLTHYCVARNQPRLQATEIADSGRTVLFTFLDATGIASRDQGHMDKCRIRFVGEDRISVQWTWYQDGQESWMEDITHERRK